MLMKKCPKCGSYTVNDECKCGEKTVSAHPFKFSLEKQRKYAKYRNASK